MCTANCVATSGTMISGSSGTWACSLSAARPGSPRRLVFSRSRSYSPGVLPCPRWGGQYPQGPTAMDGVCPWDIALPGEAPWPGAQHPAAPAALVAASPGCWEPQKRKAPGLPVLPDTPCPPQTTTGAYPSSFLPGSSLACLGGLVNSRP